MKLLILCLVIISWMSSSHADNTATEKLKTHLKQFEYGGLENILKKKIFESSRHKKPLRLLHLPRENKRTSV